MSLSPEFQSLLARCLEGAGGITSLFNGEESTTWAEAREDYVAQLEKTLLPPPGVTFDMVELDGVPTLRVTPDDLEEGRALFYMHGGGYVHGGPGAYRSITGHYAKKLRARVYIPDYRQAPEYQFPVPIDDTLRAYGGLLAMGQDPKQVVFSGDSAGGALVVTIMRKARDAGLPLPVAGVAISPWADLAHAGESARSRNGRDPTGANVETLNKLVRLFLGDELPSHPDASPIHADLRGLPPVLIQMGENEVMLSGGISLAERLADQRVRVTLEVWPGMFHVWPIFVGHLAEADEALDNAVTFLLREYNRAASKS